MTLLHDAIERRERSLVKEYLEKGFKDRVNEKRTYNNWQSPLMLAASMRDLPIIQILIDHGADVHQVDNHDKLPLEFNYGRAASTSAIFYAVSGLHRGWDGSIKAAASVAACKLLVEHGADLNSTDSFGRTLLHHAVGVRAFDDDPAPTALFEYLINEGVNPAIKDSKGRTALDHARCNYSMGGMNNHGQKFIPLLEDLMAQPMLWALRFTREQVCSATPRR